MDQNLQLTTTDETTHSLDIIRSETALSRYPAHNLSTGNISIEIKKSDDKGVVTLLWKVSYNSEYGQPGERAYKLDTLIVNRRIDELKRSDQSVPKVIKLGSLREICAELELTDSGKNKSDIKEALLQNASAFITVKGISYKSTDKTERTLDAGFTRYSVIFTGDKLPNGLKADAVYLILNDIYMEVLNNAVRRPLDYNYLRDLAAAPQRFYEIISYQMLPAVRYNQRAKLAYSEFCMFSTMTRYFDFNHVKKQMWKFHRPHIIAGYITKVEYEATVDTEGKPDWNMFYTPGERARFQQLVFSFDIPYVPRKRKKPEKTSPRHASKMAEPSQTLFPVTTTSVLESGQVESLVKKFYQLRYGQPQNPTAKECDQAREHLAIGEEWANYLVEVAAKQGKEQNGFPENFGGVGRLSIKFQSEFETERQKQAAERQQKARQSHTKAHRSAYLAFLEELVGGKLEEALPDAYRAFNTEEERTHRFHKLRAEKSTRSSEVVATFYETENRVRRLLEFIERNPKSGIPTFWQWDLEFNLSPFRETEPLRDSL